MMTIKEFSYLCGCNTQTLRYYDKIGLLKPVKVDQYSGYRYYTKCQAVDFVKIKNLQAADFTINEIKALLKMPDLQVCEMFYRKIEEQAHKLERIKEIQQSYLTEKANMEKIVQSATDYLFHTLTDYEEFREFGVDPADGIKMIAKLREFFERTTLKQLSATQDVQLILNGYPIHGTERILDTLESLKDNGYEDTVLLGDRNVGEADDLTQENGETVWQKHGWQFVYEFIDDIPNLEKGYEYCFCFELVEGKCPKDSLKFPMFMIAVMLQRMGAVAYDIFFGCNIKDSEDGQNHFTLLRRKLMC